LTGVPLALVLTTGPGEAGLVQELLDELLLTSEVSVLRPHGLSVEAITALAAELLGPTPDASFVAACRQATDGNPFLVLELFGELHRRGIAPSGANAGLAGQLSSHGVGRAVRARLRRLPAECAALARAVAVLGDPAEPRLAARLAGLDDQVEQRARDALVEEGLFEPGPRAAFVHSLVRSSVYSELSARERGRYHALAAQLLAAAGGAHDRIAIHLLATGPAGDAATVGTLRRAAEEAGCRGAPDVAVAYLRRALAEPPPAHLEPVLSHELGRAALRAGDLELAIEELRKATRGLADPASRAEAANALGSALFVALRPEEAMTDLTDVIAGLPEREREHGLRLQATRWAAVRGSIDVWRRLQLADERFHVASRAPRTVGERLQTAVAAYEAARTGTAAEARELALQALADGRLLEDPGPDSGGFWIAPLVLLLAHADDDGARVATAVIEWAQEHGSLPAFAMAAQLRAYARLRSGSLAEAEADASSALEHPGLPGFPPFGRVVLANVLLARGRPTEAADVLARVEPEPATSGHIRYLQTRARIRAASRQTEDALDDLTACGRIEHEWQILTPAFGTWRADAAPLLARLGRHDEARALAREELERCRAFGVQGSLGIALRTLGLVESGDTAIELLRQAADELEQSPRRLEHALGLLELGAATRRAGRRSEARTPLRAALELARACGADAVASRAHEELVAAGARPRRDPTESRSHLTAAELRVARLAGEGMSNREVAQALFLTENTIETHLRSVFRKLDIRSRSQLARAL
jgi:DNA-binding CsgD family transcriptional regulator